MTYLHLDTLTQATLHEIRAAHPQVSIPDGADLAHLGYAPLTLTDQPEVEDWHIAEPGAPEQGADGWHTTWVVREMSAQERASAALQTIIAVETAAHVDSQRLFRETTLAMVEKEALALGYTLEQLAAKNKGYRLLKEFDMQIAALREQLP
jgi:hypothetical protein